MKKLAMHLAQRSMVANQIEYSPFNQRDELVDYCLQNNIKIFAYNIFLKGSKHLDEIQLNDKYRIIIAWLILKKIKPIFGCSSKEHLLNNLEEIQIDIDSYQYLENINKKIIMYPKHD